MSEVLQPLSPDVCVSDQREDGEDDHDQCHPTLADVAALCGSCPVYQPYCSECNGGCCGSAIEAVGVVQYGRLVRYTVWAMPRCRRWWWQGTLIKVLIEQLRGYQNVAEVFQELRILNASETRVHRRRPCIVEVGQGGSRSWGGAGMYWWENVTA